MSAHLDEIQAKLFEIQYLRGRLEKDVETKRTELLKLALMFDTYEELYTYGKKIASTPEEFNEMMLRARDVFFTKNKKDRIL